MPDLNWLGDLTDRKVCLTVRAIRFLITHLIQPRWYDLR